MSKLQRQLDEDRAMRDTARDLFKGDVSLIRSELDHKSVSARLASRVGTGAAELIDDAAGFAEANPGKLALGAGAALGVGAAALALWLAREPILNTLSGFLGQDDESGDGEVPQELTDSSE